MKWTFMLRLTKLIHIFLLSIVVLAMPVNAIADEKAAVGTYEDWNDLDKVEIKQLFNLNDYATITVEPFDTSNIELPEKDDNTYEPVIEAQSLFNQRFLAQMKKEMEAKPVSDKVDAPQESTLLVRGKVVSMNPGIKSLRMFVGLGAGHAGVIIDCELVDPKTNTVLATLTQKRASSNGDYDEALEELTEELAEDTSTLINLFK